MSLPVFADSFFYLALLNPRDEYHETVRNWATNYRGRAITTETVLLEVGDAFCGPEQRPVLLELCGSCALTLGLRSFLSCRTWANAPGNFSSGARIRLGASRIASRLR